jgi:hypothetical protein
VLVARMHPVSASNYLRSSSRPESVKVQVGSFGLVAGTRVVRRSKKTVSSRSSTGSSCKSSKKEHPTTLAPTSSANPSLGPSVTPSALPTVFPSASPSTASPTSVPTVYVSAPPSVARPSSLPSDAPSLMPSDGPSLMPSFGPSLEPSSLPSISPTLAIVSDQVDKELDDENGGLGISQKALIGSMVVLATAVVGGLTFYYKTRDQ